MQEKYILFVCLGNICRSPSAEGLFRSLVQKENLHEVIKVDSAGTGPWHEGHPPDKRAQKAMLSRGIDISGLRARQVNTQDFQQFDHILAMDNDNLKELRGLCPKPHGEKIRLLLDFAEAPSHSEVPDPFYGAEDDFELMLDLIHEGARGLLSHLR